MDITALPASPLPGAAPTAAPTAGTPAGDFARSLEQAAGRQPDAASQTPADSAEADVRHTVAQTTAPLLAAAWPTLPPASGDRMANAPSEDAVELAELTDAELALLDPQAGLVTMASMPAAALATASASSAAGAPSDLQEIRSRLRAIENAGNLDAQAASSAAFGLLPTAGRADHPAGATAVTPMAAAMAVSPSVAHVARLEGKDDNSAAQLPAPLASAGQSAAQPSTTESAAAATTSAQAPRLLAEALPLATEAGTSGAANPIASAQQQAGNPLPVNGTGASTASLSAPLASPEWQRGLEQQVFGLHQRGEQQIELHLHPAELGPLTISLKLGESSAQAQFLSAHAQVRAAVEQAIPQLREALAEQGITLGETSVGEQQYRSPQDQPAPSGKPGISLASSGAGGAGEGNAERPAAIPARLSGGIDLYA